MKKSTIFLFTILSVIIFSGNLLADTIGTSAINLTPIAPIGAGLAIGCAALGGGIGQGLAANAALMGIARNPGASNKILVPMILAMALIESLVLFGLLISIMILGKM